METAPLDTSLLDAAVTVLSDHRKRWARLPLREKIQYLSDVRDLALRHAQDWVEAGMAMKGLPPGSPLEGSEEWLSGPYPTVSWLTDVMATLSALRTGADPLAGLDIRTTPTGQVAVRVFPASIYDRLLLHGYELDVWMQPGVTQDNLRETVGAFYREPEPAGRVTLVLGAGNVSAIPMLDTLYSLIAEGDVVVLKMNPVNASYGPVFERILDPLIRDGYVQIVYGGADVGAFLTDHDAVEAIHITGSERTFTTIVFGPGAEGERRRAAGTPILTKPIRSELGGVGPTIIVPGPWTDADIAYQAEHLATQKLHNSGHTCVASQVLILPSDWTKTDALLDALRAALRASPARHPFYPGAEGRQEAFRAAHPDAEALPGDAKRTLLVGVDPASDHPAFTDEFFGPIYTTTSLPGADAAAYLASAVDFANNRLHGNLGANIIVHPSTARELGSQLDRAVADLAYGAIGINVWSAFVFLASRGAWGAFPGNTVDDIQSGVGFVHNALLFDRPQKNVVRAPFRTFPRSLRHGQPSMAVKPPWFLSNRTATTTARHLTSFAADPKPQRLVGLFTSALRG